MSVVQNHVLVHQRDIMKSFFNNFKTNVCLSDEMSILGCLLESYRLYDRY